MASPLVGVYKMRRRVSMKNWEGDLNWMGKKRIVGESVD
jgi:hypothetical protein